MENIIYIDDRPVTLNGEENVLELARKAGIELPTFCYHSELSIYGACRLCLVEVEGMGMTGSCSLRPQPGMKIRTNTAELREIRKITLELLLANHHQACPTCGKSDSCKLLALARRLGVETVRFKPVQKTAAIDCSSPALIRDPNKCILCGDCVRFCAEVQDIGAIDFAYRGTAASVLPAFGKDLNQVECVHCGQCARVCPTGAIMPKPEIDPVWQAISDPDQRVVAQIAPAVRVAVGEAFALPPGTDTTGKIAAALKALGFDAVFDTAFAADLTVIEEATEFLQRLEAGKNMPQFTSCCPAWVKFAEQYYPELLPHLSSCRSPQQMFGSLAKSTLPQAFGVRRENLTVVSIMPCTAKKFEATREEFRIANDPDVSNVLTTQELIRMIREAGLDFNNLEPVELDQPFGSISGAGVIFGNSGGVSEAVLRYVAQQLDIQLNAVDLVELRSANGIREAVVKIGDRELRLAIVHGLKNARQIAEKVLENKAQYDLIEVMACPGGCIGGAGQPVTFETAVREQRQKGLQQIDEGLQCHSSDCNPQLQECYNNCLQHAGSKKAHELLHTHYRSRKRIEGSEISLSATNDQKPVELQVCVGTSCFLRGSQHILQQVMTEYKKAGLADRLDIKATFCHERCNRGPVVRVDGDIIEKCTYDKLRQYLDQKLTE